MCLVHNSKSSGREKEHWPEDHLVGARCEAVYCTSMLLLEERSAACADGPCAPSRAGRKEASWRRVRRGTSTVAGSRLKLTTMALRRVRQIINTSHTRAIRSSDPARTRPSSAPIARPSREPSSPSSTSSRNGESSSSLTTCVSIRPVLCYAPCLSFSV